MKNKLYINTILSVIIGSGIGTSYIYNETKGYNIVNNSELTTEKTIKKVFEPGTHIIGYSNFVMDASMIYEGYVDLDIDVPEGYELVDYKISDSRYIGPTDGYFNRGYFVFVNTDEVEATGVYSKDKGKYLFSTPGVVVKKEKKVKTRKR